jgi:hypothetical protein
VLGKQMEENYITHDAVWGLIEVCGHWKWMGKVRVSGESGSISFPLLSTPYQLSCDLIRRQSPSNKEGGKNLEIPFILMDFYA